VLPPVHTQLRYKSGTNLTRRSAWTSHRDPIVGPVALRATAQPTSADPHHRGPAKELTAC
jgi:hypothetical protein